MIDNHWYVWAPDDGDRPKQPNIWALAPEAAAVAWVEARHAALDHPAEILVNVASKEGYRFEFLVTAETVTQFKVVGPR